jgi:hypothetical protein
MLGTQRQEKSNINQDKLFLILSHTRENEGQATPNQARTDYQPFIHKNNLKVKKSTPQQQPRKETPKIWNTESLKFMALTPPSINITNNVNSKIEINIAGNYKIDPDVIKASGIKTTTKPLFVNKPKISFPNIEYTCYQRPVQQENAKRNN